MPMFIGSHRELGGRHGMDSLPQPLKEHGWHLDFRLLATRSVREWVSVVLNHPMCCNLSGLPQEMNILYNLYWNTHCGNGDSSIGRKQTEIN